MKEQQLERERQITLRNIANKQKETSEQQAAAMKAQQLDMSRPTGASGAAPVPMPSAPAVPADGAASVGTKRRSRWDQSTDAAKCVLACIHRVRPAALCYFPVPTPGRAPFPFSAFPDRPPSSRPEQARLPVGGRRRRRQAEPLGRL